MYPFNRNYTYKEALPNLVRQGFFVCLLFLFITNCNYDKKVSTDSIYHQYILDDQGAIYPDRNFTFKKYQADINGDQIHELLFITSYMDNYFAYLFDGKSQLEIPQSGWVNFISKPGHPPHVLFHDLNCDGKQEIIQYGISGHSNNIVQMNILSVHHDSLINMLTENLTWIDSQTPKALAYQTMHYRPKQCGIIYFVPQGILSDTIKHKITHILNTEIQSVNLNKALKYTFDSLTNRFVQMNH